MTRQEAIEYGTDRLDLFGGKMEEFIKLSVEALKEQEQAKKSQPEIIEQLCFMVDDININEIYSHNDYSQDNMTLRSWLRSWRGEMKRLINKLDMREGES